MHKHSAQKTSQAQNHPQPNKYKDMNYANHPEKYPLELHGTMKRHSQPHGQQNIKSIINYDECNPNQSSDKYKNCHNSRLSHNSQSRNSYLRPSNNTSGISSALAQKIMANNKLASNNYEKSVIPESDPRSVKQRPQSVKTYKEGREGTGVNYVMAAEEKNLYKQVEKRHVEEYHLPRRENYGKKCNISSGKKQNESSQFVSLMNENFSTENYHQAPNAKEPSQKSFSNSISQVFYTLHPSTTTKRITNDIHSSFTKKQSTDQKPPAKNKYESQDMFKSGASLGYEYQKRREIGSQKMMEMMGSEGYWAKKGNTETLRQRRDDWRRSTIVIE